MTAAQRKANEAAAASIGLDAAAVRGDIERAWDDYRAHVAELATQVALAVVHPFCARRGLTYAAGMGDWLLRDPANTVLIFGSYSGREASALREDESDPELLAIIDLLDTPVEGFPQNNLGSFMPDYPSTAPILGHLE